MSFLYPSRPGHAQRYMSTHRSMGDWMDDASQWLKDVGVTGPRALTSEDQQCMNMADAARQPLLNQTLDLRKNWNPTGFYSVDQVKTILQTTMNALNQSVGAVDKVAEDPQLPGHRDVLDEARTSMLKVYGQSNDYIGAIRDANAKGIDVIDSEGLREWVLDAFREATSGVFAAAWVACQRPWWIDVLAVYNDVWQRVWSVVKDIVGVVVAVGQAVLAVPATVNAVITYLKWGIVLGLGYWVYQGGHLPYWNRLKTEIGL